MKHCFILVFLSISMLPETLAASDFYAFYTKLHTGESWEENSKTGPFADLIVRLDSGQLVFHRERSYLPFWETDSGRWFLDEIIFRSGDGPRQRPDKNNIYSFVRLIHENKDSIVVHWRYFPDFKLDSHAEPVGGNVGFDGVVHEYFSVYPSGRIRRVIREGSKSRVDWDDVKNRSVQILQLEKSGIREISRQRAKLSRSVLHPVPGSSIRKPIADLAPFRSWSFDEGLMNRDYSSKDETIESITGRSCLIDGPKTVWKKGVSGTALGFDGYTSKMTCPDFVLPEFEEEGGFTLEVWVAPGAYSICSWTAIVHQSEWEADVRENVFQMRNWGKMQLGEKFKRGFFLGINEYGHPVLFMSAGEEIVEITARQAIPLYEWSHLAFTYIDEGMVYLYVNGSLEDFSNFSGHLSRSDRDFLIGRNDESIEYVSQHVVRTYSTFPSPLGFEGLIDEVKVYTEVLDHETVKQSWLAFKPENPRADMQSRTLPGRIGPSDSFGAQYTHLNYHDLWDNMWREADHPDIVVKFDRMPTSVVFWRGCRSPGWVTETNKWICDQSTELTDWHWENESEGAQSCCEHMSDYEARHSHVRLIENSDARVVVHWRYASVDVLYKHPNTCRNEDGWGVWTDEYLTIYPDGVGVRFVDQHGDKDYYHNPEEGMNIGFHDTQFLSEAGTKPEDNIHYQSLTIVSHQDRVTELDWEASQPSGLYDAQIIWINLKSNYKVFEVFPPGTEVNVWASSEKTTYSRYSAWNHYPVTQAPCDGRFCVAPDRLAHSALGAADNIAETGNMLLYGFTDESAESLIPLARSWNSPANVVKIKGGKSLGYDKAQRVYRLSSKGTRIDLTLAGSGTSPVFNPCFIVQGWSNKVNVEVNGKMIPEGDQLRQGLIRDANGNLQLVVWLETQSDDPIEVSFEMVN